MGLNPKEANSQKLADGVLELLPLYLEKEGVVAVGEIGYDDITPAEERCFSRQIELAKDADLPILIHTPHRDKKRGTERTLALVRDHAFPPERTLVDHNTEETVALVVDTGHYMGFSIYPDTKMTEERVGAIFARYGLERMIINSAADWGRSDPLKVPKTAAHLRERGFSEADVAKLVWSNPVAFFSQGGRIDPAELEEPLAVDRGPYLGNSLLRGGQSW
jgi:predicted metal-dependent TIM-barrel fold hydrolase